MARDGEGRSGAAAFFFHATGTLLLQWRGLGTWGFDNILVSIAAHECMVKGQGARSPAAKGAPEPACKEKGGGN